MNSFFIVFLKKVIRYVEYKSRGVYLDLKSNVLIRGKTGCNIEITDSTIYVNEVGHGSKLYKCTCMGNIKIGNYVCIFGEGTILSSVKSHISIGNYSAIGQNVTIQDSNHRIDRASVFFMSRDMFNGDISEDMVTKGSVILEEDVWVGSNSVILSGVNIGRGAIVGAGSVVTKNVEPYSIVVGNPAKEIRKRFNEETILELENSKWWLWSKKEVSDNKKFFLCQR